jgi:16S rRNA (cytidine1402-2'-O)-methyltransferase
MTKQFEEVKRGTVSELRAYYEDRPPRGEVVLVIAAAVETVPTDELVQTRVNSLRASGMSTRDAATMVAAELGVSKRVAYRLAQQATKAGEDE